MLNRMTFVINFAVKTKGFSSVLSKQRMFLSNYSKCSTIITCPLLNHVKTVKSVVRKLPVNFIRFKTDLNVAVKTPTVQLKKRPAKKKKPNTSTDKLGFCQVIAYNTAKEYDLEKLLTGLTEQDVYQPTEFGDEIGNSQDVIHATAKYQIGNEPREIFFFRDGSVVMWNISKLESLSILSFLKKFQKGDIDIRIVEDESEVMSYSYCPDNTKTHIQGDTIIICPDDISLKLKKYTISNAMALSVNLGTWEATLDQYIDSMEDVTEDLKFGKKIDMSQNEVLQKSGQLFALRHVINLSSDLLDTPDFYWDREALEKLYQKTFNYFCIDRRTKVMNEKLNHCLELVELLQTHLSDRHHVRLEWMIIILIMVEVAFEILHYAEWYLEVDQTDYNKNNINSNT